MPFSEIRFVDLGHTRIAYREEGAGEPLLLLHGWPFHGGTFRKLVPLLAPHFRCIVPDLPGTGETEWTAETPFDYREQVWTMADFAEKLGLFDYHLLAHDTGATLARQLTLDYPQRVRRLLLLNTEVPGQRPPWIPLYSRLFHLPLSEEVMRALYASKLFLNSSAGFAGCYWNRGMLDAEFHQLYVEPLLRSKVKRQGYARYLAGFDWSLVDELGETQRHITQPVLLVWGAGDPTFPLEPGRRMASDFPNCRGFREIPNTRLLLHEERPQEVAKEVIGFFSAND
jgi:pimeloyl-ACP methyl ester carboxylesterase